MTIVSLLSEKSLERQLHEQLCQGQLPDCFLYVGQGAGNWLALDRSPRFGIASGLTELLRRNVGEVARLLARWPQAGDSRACDEIGHKLDVLSVGVGEGIKERILLDALLPLVRVRYLAVDISRPLVEKALAVVAHLDIDSVGVVSMLEELPRLRCYRQRPTVLCLLGNNFCNYEPTSLLDMLRRELAPHDRLLLDCHLCPEGPPADGWRRRVEASYRNQTNVAFNLGPLVQRGVRPEDCQFQLDLELVPGPHGDVFRTFKQIDILRDSVVRLGGQLLPLRHGQRIQMGFTYKYRPSQVVGLLADHGLGILGQWSSEDGENLLLLAGRTK